MQHYPPQHCDIVLCKFSHTTIMLLLIDNHNFKYFGKKVGSFDSRPYGKKLSCAYESSAAQSHRFFSTATTPIAYDLQ